jgi:hypothetical protein
VDLEAYDMGGEARKTWVGGERDEEPGLKGGLLVN